LPCEDPLDYAKIYIVQYLPVATVLLKVPGFDPAIFYASELSEAPKSVVFAPAKVYISPSEKSPLSGI